MFEQYNTSILLKQSKKQSSYIYMKNEIATVKSQETELTN